MAVWAATRKWSEAWVMSPSACFHASGSFNLPRAIWMPRSLSSCHRPAGSCAQHLEVWVSPQWFSSCVRREGSPQMQSTGWPRRVESSMALLTRCGLGCR